MVVADIRTSGVLPRGSEATLRDDIGLFSGKRTGRLPDGRDRTQDPAAPAGVAGLRAVAS